MAVDTDGMLVNVQRFPKKFIYFKKIDPEFTAIETRYGSGYRWNVN